MSAPETFSGKTKQLGPGQLPLRKPPSPKTPLNEKPLENHFLDNASGKLLPIDCWNLLLNIRFSSQIIAKLVAWQITFKHDSVVKNVLNCSQKNVNYTWIPCGNYKLDEVKLNNQMMFICLQKLSLLDTEPTSNILSLTLVENWTFQCNSSFIIVMQES